MIPSAFGVLRRDCDIYLDACSLLRTTLRKKAPRCRRYNAAPLSHIYPGEFDKMPKSAKVA